MEQPPIRECLVPVPSAEPSMSHRAMSAATQGDLDLGDVRGGVGLRGEPPQLYLCAGDLPRRFLQYLDLMALIGAQVAQLRLPVREILPQSCNFVGLLLAGRARWLANGGLERHGYRRRRRYGRRWRDTTTQGRTQQPDHGPRPRSDRRSMRSDRASISRASEANVLHQCNYTTSRIGARKLR